MAAGGGGRPGSVRGRCVGSSRGLGVRPGVLRARVGRAGIDAGDRPGATAEVAQRIGEPVSGARRVGCGPVRSCAGRGRVSPGRGVSAAGGGSFIDDGGAGLGARAGSARRLPAPTPGSPRAPAWARRSRSPGAGSLRDDGPLGGVGRVHKGRLLGVRGPRDARRAGSARDRRASRCRSRGGGAPPVRLMCGTGLHGVRRAKSPRTTRSAPKGAVPGRPGEPAFQRFQAERAVGGGHHLRAHHEWLGARGLRDGRLLPAGHRPADLHRVRARAWPPAP